MRELHLLCFKRIILHLLQLWWGRFLGMTCYPSRHLFRLITKNDISLIYNANSARSGSFVFGTFPYFISSTAVYNTHNTTGYWMGPILSLSSDHSMVSLESSLIQVTGKSSPSLSFS